MFQVQSVIMIYFEKSLNADLSWKGENVTENWNSKRDFLLPKMKRYWRL